MIIYGIPNCNTVKKTLDWLTVNGFDYEFHNFKKNGISPEKLNQWCAIFGWETVLNKKGTTWNKLSLEEQKDVVDQASVVSFLLTHTSAIKRPIVEQNGKAILLSFNEGLYSEVLKNP
ncbi:arsenate reductase [Pedobacter sp. CG_S7]|uniref:arsenate reductase n=1 Tax=Pedobacter sp. CG_S7 TaxID=3143930 RepID=UPI0033970FAD